MIITSQHVEGACQPLACLQSFSTSSYSYFGFLHSYSLYNSSYEPADDQEDLLKFRTTVKTRSLPCFKYVFFTHLQVVTIFGELDQ